MPSKHAILSPSASHRWIACPGSVQANADKPFTQNDHALLGTTAHALLEMCLRLAAEPMDFIGQVLQKGLFPVDEDMADGVGYALDYVREYTANNPKAKVHCEHEVIIAPQLGMDDDTVCWGTSDVIIDNYPSEVVVLDYKHGVGVQVSVKANTQLLLYAAGMRQQRGRYRRYRKVVVQPRVRGRKPVQEASVTDKELAEWLDGTAKPAAVIALKRDAPRNPGDHCRFCHADGRCPAQYAEVVRAAQKEFKASDPKGLTPADLSAALTAYARIKQIGEAITKHAVSLVHAGVAVPGWKADFTAPRRVWADEDEATSTLAQLGLDKRERYSVDLISPAQAEKVLKAKKLWPRKPRGSAGEDFVDPLKHLVAYTEASPTIKPSTQEQDTA